MEKHFIQSQQLLKDSFELAWRVYESGYRPNYIVGVWRGGAPIGIAVQEFLDVLGVKSDHIAIRTSYYSGIAERKKSVQVYGLNYIIRKLESEDSLLIVDDVHDTGISIQKIILDLLKELRDKGKTVLVITHDLDSLKDHFDYVWLLNIHTIAFGKPDQVLTKENLIHCSIFGC